MPRKRVSFRVGNDYERVPSVPGEYRIKKLPRSAPGGHGIQYYTPPNKTFQKVDLLEKLAQVRTRHVRIDLVGYLRSNARYHPDDYTGGVTYLSRNVPSDVLYIYERLATTTDVGWRIRDFLNDLTGFEFAVIEEVRFVERGHPQNKPVLSSRFASDKKAGRF